MKEHLRRIVFALLIFAIAGLVVRAWQGQGQGGEYGLFDLLRGEKPASEEFTEPLEAVLPGAEVELLTRLDQEYSALAEAVLPSVVSVTTQTVRRGSYGWHPFWGVLQQRAQVIPGLGSGAIISREGHVVTNYHVIEGVNEVMITTQDNRQYPARILGASPQRDIAVLKIESNRRDFPALAFADSDEVRVGQLVVAVGNPFGLSGTVTRGIISARDRHLNDSSLDYLQTDAVINPGNSGGPLVNVRGQIVGINVAIYRGDENVRAWQGVGLAVPAKDAQTVIRSVLNRGGESLAEQIVPGFLGIEVAAEPVVIDRSLGAGAVGALIMDVVPNSPAMRAGLRAGDVVSKLNDTAVTTPSDLLQQIQALPAEETVMLRVVRENQITDIEAVLGPRPVLSD